MGLAVVWGNSKSATLPTPVSSGLFSCSDVFDFLSLSGEKRPAFLMTAHPVLPRLALAELYLTLATIFSRFDFQLYETGIENIQLGSDGYMPSMKSPYGVGVLVKRVERG